MGYYIWLDPQNKRVRAPGVCGNKSPDGVYVCTHHDHGVCVAGDENDMEIAEWLARDSGIPYWYDDQPGLGKYPKWTDPKDKPYPKPWPLQNNSNGRPIHDFRAYCAVVSINPKCFPIGCTVNWLAATTTVKKISEDVEIVSREPEDSEYHPDYDGDVLKASDYDLPKLEDMDKLDKEKLTAYLEKKYGKL